VRSALDALETAVHVETVRFVLFDAGALKAFVRAAEKLVNSRTGFRIEPGHSPGRIA
jgi:hypothetical protein